MWRDERFYYLMSQFSFLSRKGLHVVSKSLSPKMITLPLYIPACFQYHRCHSHHLTSHLESKFKNFYHNIPYFKQIIQISVFEQQWEINRSAVYNPNPLPTKPRDCRTHHVPIYPSGPVLM